MNPEICCLVLAHKDVRQLERLINRLEHPGVSVFVHLDKKMHISEAEKGHLFRNKPKVHIMPDRVSCFLDDWSLVDATMRLLDFAKSKGRGIIS